MNLEFIELNQNAYTLIGMGIVIALAIFWQTWCRERVYILGVFATSVVSVFLLVISGALLFELGDPLMASIMLRLGLNKEGASSEYIQSVYFDVNNPVAWKVLPVLDNDWTNDKDCALALNKALFGIRYFDQAEKDSKSTSTFTYSYAYWPLVSSIIIKYSPEKWINKEYLVQEIVDAEDENEAKSLVSLLTHVDGDWRKSKEGALLGQEILRISYDSKHSKYKRNRAFKIFKSLGLKWYEVKAIRYGIVESIISRDQRYAITVKSSDDVKITYNDIVATHLEQGGKVGRSQIVGFTKNLIYESIERNVNE